MDQIIHYIIVIPLILVIIFYQIRVFVQANHKIDLFKAIFPSSRLAYSINKVSIISEFKKEYGSDMDDPDDIWRDDDSSDEDVVFKEVEVSQISVPSENQTLKDIQDALNMYLQKNSGAVSDFSLMKDVVERHCGAEEEEITVMQPIPLYMGLMGTMIGIIVGISVIAANGGVGSLTNVSSMMTCVAIAMVASLVGIIFTTVISWRSKGAKTVVESRKNVFYSWLQTELLPVLSGNTVTALSLLQSNLMTFNETFKGNIKEFDSVLASVRKVSRDQADALGAISRIDIARVAQANVTVLKELQNSTAQIERFNQYLRNVNGYLDAVNSLNSNLTNHLDRTAAIERMGAFFEREMDQFREREDVIRQAVGGVELALQESFNQLVSSMESYVSELKSQTTSELDTIRDAYEQRQRDFIAKIQAQQESLSKSAEAIEKVLQSTEDMSETKKALVSMSNDSHENSRRIGSILELLRSSGSGLEKNPVQVVGLVDEAGGRRKKRTRFGDFLNIAVKVAIIIAFVLYAIEFMSKFFMK